MSSKISVDALADTVMKYMDDYAKVSAEDMKKAVKNAGDTIKKDISATAPKDTGAYAKSWAVKKTKETSHALEITVHSKNRYQIAHLLEHGHAKRGGGRVAAKPHIAAAEERGITQLQNEIERSLKDG
ncbi:HK97 gp10 family phage protein [uncultured Clostridium sp.]|uniref:HK97 gp10 family phage protein n=1 Tax=uncultured Clostridium sp. TaxID=59620 RepID=UPI0025F8DFBE|nr:HK97 gp10 family phage protein [uncultured Clostridium sp.]